MKKNLKKLKIILGAVGLSTALSLNGCNKKEAMNVEEEKEIIQESDTNQEIAKISCIVIQDYQDCMNHTYFYRLNVYDENGTFLFSIEKSTWKEVEEFLKYDLFSNITTLQLWFNGFDTDAKKIDLKCTENFLDLKRLFVDNLGTLEIDPIDASQLTSLEDLILNNCGITDISLLNGLSQLKYLELNNNLIENFENFNMPESLEYLNVENNNINDLSGIKTPKKGLSMNLIGNTLTEEDRPDLIRLGQGSMADHILKNQKQEMTLIRNNH